MDYGMFAFGMIGLVVMASAVLFLVMLFDTSDWDRLDDYCCNGSCNQGRDCPMRKKDD